MEARKRKIICEDREKVLRFIAAYRNLPILWDTQKHPNFSKKNRTEAYDKLLEALREVKQGATLLDLKRKINSMRSNFRKEMKKIDDFAAMGTNYQPSSWMYHELSFLKCTYSSAYSTIEVSDEEDSSYDLSQSCETDGYITLSEPLTKIPKYSESNHVDIPNNSTQSRVKLPSECLESNQNDIPIMLTEFSEAEQPISSESNHNTIQSDTYAQAPISSDLNQSNNAAAASVAFGNCMGELAKVWVTKLNHLEPLQRIFAEKAINDVLFEAQLGTLHRHSVQINAEGADKINTFACATDQFRNFEASQSSVEYKFNQTVGFEGDDHK